MYKFEGIHECLCCHATFNWMVYKQEGGIALFWHKDFESVNVVGVPYCYDGVHYSFDICCPKCKTRQPLDNVTPSNV